MTTTVRYPFRSAKEYAELVATMHARCLGCGAEVAEECDRGIPVWQPHGTSCARYYGAGRRVDYDEWCRILGRVTDEPLFRIWAEGEPMHGVPSWVPV